MSKAKQDLRLLTHIDIFFTLRIELWRKDGSHEVLVDNLSNRYHGFNVSVDKPAIEGDIFVIRHGTTGGLIGKTSLKRFFAHDKLGFVFEPGDMTNPNAIGQPPEPSDEIILPNNSERIVVGSGVLRVSEKAAGKWGNTVHVVHEQFWRRGKDSYALGPEQTKTLTVEQQSGVTMSSETETELNAIAGASISGGYGPFSASLSASLNYGSTHRTAQTLSTEVSTVTEGTVHNPSAEDVAVYAWELVDVYHLISTKRQAIVENTQSPPLLRVYTIPGPG